MVKSHEPLAHRVLQNVKQYLYIVFMFWLHNVDMSDVLKQDMPITKSE